MANPQPTDAHLRIAHTINEQLMVSHFSEQQRRILDFILRLSWGCGKKEANIPHQRDFAIVGVREGHVKAHLDWLIEARVIIREDCLYQFNKDFDQWRVSRATGYTKRKLTEIVSLNLNHRKPQLTEKGSRNLRNTEDKAYGIRKRSTPNLATGKERLNKVLKKDVYIIPEWIDKDIWESFLEMRREKKSVPTEKAKQLLIKELEKLKAQGHNPNEVLERSIMNSWKGVFPLDSKGGQGGKTRGHSQIPDRDSYTKRPPDPRLTKLIEQERAANEVAGRDESG